MFNKIKNNFINTMYTLKDGYQKMIEDEKKREEMIMMDEASKQAIFLLKNMEFKHLSCFPKENFPETRFDELLSKVQDCDFKLLVMRTINYQEDGGSVLEFGIEYSIQNRNELISYVLNKYLNRFKHLIVEMKKEEQETFFNQLKDVQLPRVLVDSVVTYEKALNKQNPETKD